MGQAVGGARVRVEERGKDLVTSPRGEFWRLLTPGLFTLLMASHGPALGQAGGLSSLNPGGLVWEDINKKEGLL